MCQLRQYTCDPVLVCACIAARFFKVIASIPLRIDIFCAVIDNFGDAGVCWRLARQLANEHSCAPRLWLDRPEVLTPLLSPVAGQLVDKSVDGVRIGDWQHAALEQPGDIVIEAFACNLPAAYVACMAGRARPPVWINLEYLSAEAWVDGSHLLPSKHPQIGLTKYFYFPGFSAQTGGLLKEALLDAQRQQFQGDRQAQRVFWQSCGAVPPRDDALSVSLFAYENAALPALLDAWAQGEQPVHCAVPLGKSLPAIANWCGEAHLQAGQVIERGKLRLVILPFLSQTHGTTVYCGRAISISCAAKTRLCGHNGRGGLSSGTSTSKRIARTGSNSTPSSKSLRKACRCRRNEH